jgi:DNA recombination protein RmuC
LLLLWLAWRASRPADTSHARDLERLERELRDELGRQGQGTRADLANFQQMLLTQGGDVARTQNEQIDAFRVQLAGTQQQTDATLRRLWRHAGRTAAAAVRGQRTRQAELRQAVDARLAALQEGNEKKLEQMRATVDEKLHATLEQRLGESFKQVADRLEQVHKGLGEMQTLARDVGSLNRVLTNVKTRGVFGEVQLAGLLEQVFTPEQYAGEGGHVPGSNDRVDFAIRLPGRERDGDGGDGSAAVAAHRCQVPARRLRTPAGRARTRRCAGDGSLGQGHRECCCGWRRAASATSTSRRRTPPTSPSSSCPPRACTPKPCAGPA